MPLLPLSPSEQEMIRPLCIHPEHNPPAHLWIQQASKRKCPQCGKENIIFPSGVTG